MDFPPNAPLPPAGPATPAILPGPGTSTGNAASVIGADFETFLQMMTTQMQNQDPLNPMESTEFATQLATFSGVEQQVRTNDLLAGLGAAFATMQMGQLTGWIGMEAQANVPVSFDGAPVTASGAQHVLADRMELIVRDASGEIVQQVPIPLDDAPFEWTGQAADGTPLPEGTYSLSVQNWAGEDMLDEQPATIHGQIEEARIVDGVVWVTFENGQSIPASSILGLRNATPPGA